MKKRISVEPIEHHKLVDRPAIKIERDEAVGSIIAKIDERAAAEVVDLADRVMVDAVIRAAKAAGVSNLYLLDRPYVLDVMKYLLEQKRVEELHQDGQDCHLYNDTVRRLARMGAKTHTAQVTALAEEIEHYRAQIIHQRDTIEKLTEGRNRVPYHEREKVYREAIEVNGPTAQQIVALEELSEAQKEICKLLRSQGSLDHLAEEVERLRRNLVAARAKKEETG